MRYGIPVIDDCPMIGWGLIGSGNDIMNTTPKGWGMIEANAMMTREDAGSRLYAQPDERDPAVLGEMFRAITGGRAPDAAERANMLSACWLAWVCNEGMGLDAVDLEHAAAPAA
jgi:hypothetical protein